jgi:YidC/Oxa1 family membrane protein insertase
MRLLRWVYAHLGNYGWSIVVLTILINLMMAPLRHFSIANGIKMAKLAPEMRVIQERYRKVPALDPKRQEMQKEVAALYARHGMSMSTQLTVGCLPLLLTMPFLFAFYRVLQTFIELRGASFLWIPDLSQQDPLFLTPILMGASMFLMQRMMPSTMDPAQQRMMMIMPLVLLGMFLWAPAGLNLYWLSSNVCSIVQQGATLKILKARGDGPEAARGAAGKTRGGGKGRRR